MKALVGALNKEKALVGAFSVIVKTGCGTDGSVYSTSKNSFAALTFDQRQQCALQSACAVQQLLARSAHSATRQFRANSPNLRTRRYLDNGYLDRRYGR